MTKTMEQKVPTSSRSVRPIEIDMNLDRKKESIMTFNEEGHTNNIA